MQPVRPRHLLDQDRRQQQRHLRELRPREMVRQVGSLFMRCLQPRHGNQSRSHQSRLMRSMSTRQVWRHHGCWVQPQLPWRIGPNIRSNASHLLHLVWPWHVCQWNRCWMRTMQYWRVHQERGFHSVLSVSERHHLRQKGGSLVHQGSLPRLPTQYVQQLYERLQGPRSELRSVPRWLCESPKCSLCPVRAVPRWL